ncbi:MAG TPA: hypothetical protein VJT31_05090 [Rugosimonospora sp.]|nr:hypothetical protein [Rugosimonospora sp.]
MDTEAQLPKPVAGDLLQHKMYVSRERYLLIARRAKAAGMSISKYLNALVDRDEVDADGRPAWAPTAISTQPTLVDVEHAA